MNLIGLLSEVFKPAVELVDEMHTSDDERLQAKHRLTELYLGFIAQALDSEAKRMDAKAAVIVAEAKSNNLLTSSWRPVTMYAFLIMLVGWWFGWVDTPQAATPEVFLTAYVNIFMEAGFKTGETVLVHGGSSGVGTAAIQLVREAGGRILVTAGTEEKMARCKDLGANLVINYRKEDFVQRVQDYTQGEGVDLDSAVPDGRG